MSLYQPSKLLRHPERLAEWMRLGHTTAPVGFDLHLTEACPHKCPHCNNNASGGGAMSESDAMRVIGQFADLGAKAVQFTGGEPLASPIAVDMAELACGSGLSVGLITNLYRLNRETAERLRKVCTWIRVSVDAGDPEDYARMHGVALDEWWKLVDRLWILANARGQSTIGMAYLTTAMNADGLKRAAKLGSDIGMDYIQVRPVAGDKWFDRDYLNEVRLEYQDKIRIEVAWHKYEQEVLRPSKCHARHFWTVVIANLDMLACCETACQHIRIGNLAESSVQEIWCRRDTMDTIANIDTSQCPLTCRMSNLNRILDGIAVPMEHEEHI